MFAHYCILLALTSMAAGYITLDYSCTKFTANYVYDQNATDCLNGLTDRVCETLFEKAVNVAQFPFPGRNDARPTKCYSSDNGLTTDDSMKSVAVSLCPKTCGFCCKLYNYKTGPTSA